MKVTNAISLNNPEHFYFGKVVSRGDFIKSAAGTRVIALIDNWIAQGMEQLASSPGWKTRYDSGSTVDFLFLGTRRRHAICGALKPSQDTSFRRFPFIAATLFEIDDPFAFLPLSPLVLGQHVDRLRAFVDQSVGTSEPGLSLESFDALRFDQRFSSDALNELYRQFLGNTSLAKLADVLSSNMSTATVRHMILATGYLLHPILTNYAIPPQNAIALPIPEDLRSLAMVKSFWLRLVNVFLSRAEFELALFSCTNSGKRRLIISFNGVTPNLFRALFDDELAQNYFVDVSESAWVDGHARRDSAGAKLSSYLNLEDLSLIHLEETFRQSFCN
jgi:type VI secretion system protein ImpM